MSDPRADYEDPHPHPGPVAATDPTGLYPCDRTQLAGWIGVFLCLVLVGLGIGYGRSLEGRADVGDVFVLALLGLPAAGYAFTGLYLILASTKFDAPRGALVLICNAMIVGPLVIPAVLVVLGFAPTMLIAMLAMFLTDPSVGSCVSFLFSVGLIVLEVQELRRWGRRLVEMLRAWLDPTRGEWW
jgi:hypothetical protein